MRRRLILLAVAALNILLLMSYFHDVVGRIYASQSDLLGTLYIAYWMLSLATLAYQLFLLVQYLRQER